MSGEGYFDQREALHAAGKWPPPPSQPPSQPAPARVVAVGRNGPQGWHVALVRGGMVLEELTPDAATRLACELADLARMLRGEEFGQ